MNFKVTITEDGLETPIERIRKMGVWLNFVGKQATKEVKRKYKTETAPNDAQLGMRAGKKWKPLRPMTIQLKQKNKDKILIEFGDLIASIRFRRVGGYNVMIFSKNSYAHKHQLGSPSEKIPARPFLGIDEKYKRRIEKSLKRYLEEGVLRV